VLVFGFLIGFGWRGTGVLGLFLLGSSEEACHDPVVLFTLWFSSPRVACSGSALARNVARWSRTRCTNSLSRSDPEAYLAWRYKAAGRKGQTTQLSSSNLLHLLEILQGSEGSPNLGIGRWHALTARTLVECAA
jgi:hypothetical protein